MSVETKKKGLRERPTYNELIEDIQFDEKIKLPNRQAKFIRESPYLSFLDGEGYTDLLEQEEKTKKQVQVEHAITKQTGDTQTANVVRAEQQNQSIVSKIGDMFRGMFSQPEEEQFHTPRGDTDQPTAGIGAVGAGGDWSDTQGWVANPPARPLDKLANKYGHKHKKGQALPSTEYYTLSPRVSQELAKHQGPAVSTTERRPQIRNIPRLMLGAIQNEPHQDLAITYTSPFAQPQDKKKQKANTTTDDGQDTYMRNEEETRPPQPTAKSKPKAKPKPTAKSKPQPEQPEQPEPVQANPKTSDPNFQKKAKATAIHVAPPKHSTELGKSRDKKHWDSKGIGYIKDQLDQRGIRIPSWKFRGRGALTKKDLLKIIYKTLVI